VAANDDGRGPRELEHLIIARPRRRRHQYFIAATKQNEAAVEQRLLAPCRDNDVARRDDRFAESLAGAVSDDLAERENAFDERISSSAGIERAFRALSDERRCWKVGLSSAEVDDGSTGGAQRFRARGDRDRCRLFEIGNVDGRGVACGHRVRNERRARSLRNLGSIWLGFRGPLYLSARQY
jgi:hypothetical protein